MASRGKKETENKRDMTPWVCDFETLVNRERTYVWAWAACNVEDNDMVVTGSTMEDFIENFLKRKGEVYFHNLSFDGRFIIDWLFRNGFEHVNLDKDSARDKMFSIVQAGTQLYSIDVYWQFTHKKKFKRTRILDSLKKLPFKVERIAKAWKLPILKGSIDYKLHRDEGHKMTDEERAYIKNDVKIVAAALKSLLADGHSKMTIGSDALATYKSMIGSKAYDRLFPELIEHEEFYPETKGMESAIRKAYRGGFTYVNPKFAGKNIRKGCVFDVNSLYPAMMYNRKLPWGLPVKFEGKYVYDELYDLYVARIIVDFKLKKDHIPTVQLKNSGRFVQNEYLTTSGGEPVEITMSSVDLKLFLEQLK